MNTKYMSMKHSNSLTMLEQDILRALRERNEAALKKLAKDFPDRVRRAVAYLEWRGIIRKG